MMLNLRKNNKLNMIPKAECLRYLLRAKLSLRLLYLIKPLLTLKP